MAQSRQGNQLRKELVRALRQWTGVPVASSRQLHSNGKKPSLIHKRSTDVLHDPWYNKVLVSCFFVAN